MKNLAFYALTTTDKRSGLSRLQSACVLGDVEAVNVILNYSPDKLDSAIALSIKTSHLAPFFSDEPVVTVLGQLAQESPPHKLINQLVENIVNIHDASLLHLAAKTGNAQHLQRLLDNGGDVDSASPETENGATPLMLAARFNDVHVVEFLVERGASLEKHDNQGYFPIHHAAFGGQAGNIARLIGYGADVNVLKEREQWWSVSDQLSPIFLAAEYGHSEAVDVLLKHGADSNSPSRYGVTPLHIAATNGHLETTQLLLRNGGNLNSRDIEDFLPLHRAAEMGHTDVVKFILHNGGSIATRTGDGQTLLHLATCLELVSYLIQNGADVNARDHRRLTPLQVAAERGQIDTVKYLLSQGANINLRDRFGCSALYDALKGGHTATADVLIKRGCELKLVNDECCAKNLIPPLLLKAASEGRTDQLDLLFQTGISVNTKSISGETALRVAVRRGHCSTVAFLVDRGAIIDEDDTHEDLPDDDKEENYDSCNDIKQHLPLCWIMKLGQSGEYLPDFLTERRAFIIQ